MLGDSAFGYCNNLSNITIPSSISVIGSNAFANTKWLTNKQMENPLVIINGILIDGKTCEGDIVIPSGVFTINDNAFSYCDSLSSIKIPGSVRTIGNSAFFACGSLSRIEISDSVTMIGDNAFDKCSSLSSIKIPDSVTTIGYNVFNNCKKLTILCTKDSYAEEYAITYRVPYKYIETNSVSPTEEATQKIQTITAKNITKTYGNKAFYLEAKTNGNGKITYASNNNKIVSVSNDGKVTIKGCGKATITIKASETVQYKAAEKKITITVKPKKTVLISVKASKAKSITVKWEKDSQVSGYILQFSTDKKFKKNVKNITISSNKTASKKVSKLKSGKKYYVRICFYKKRWKEN